MYKFFCLMLEPPESIHDGKDTEQGYPRNGGVGYMHGWSDHSGREKGHLWGQLHRFTLM